jgi:hypothetical protein
MHRQIDASGQVWRLVRACVASARIARWQVEMLLRFTSRAFSESRMAIVGGSDATGPDPIRAAGSALPSWTRRPSRQPPLSFAPDGPLARIEPAARRTPQLARAWVAPSRWPNPELFTPSTHPNPRLASRPPGPSTESHAPEPTAAAKTACE